ncbi:putative integral membrane protein [Neofusicoccum parvum UCRNP2]|uniref:Putative integral membrane protein n=1 Tax=Botryosphaeria parva (strain UCR-NP2) TaxID=1287680 RepID=R1EET8_BOTPV|nr:putative integral membrane protein [Neofusicoccum parvum UCRNP2]
MGKTLMPPPELILAWQTDRDAYPRGVRQDWLLVVLASVLSALTVVVVFTRLIARLRVQRSPGLDDVFITPALFTFATSLLYIWGTGLTKLSVLLFYRRLTAASLPTPFLYAVHASLLSVGGYVLAFTASLPLTCAPAAAYWRQVDLAWAAAHAGRYRCADEAAALAAANAVSAAQDFLACALPGLLFWNLRVPRRRKLAMAALLGVSIL